MTQKQYKSLVAELRAEIKEIKKALATAQKIQYVFVTQTPPMVMPQPAPYNPVPNATPWPPSATPFPPNAWPTNTCNTATSTSDLRGVQVHL
jgi:hypothetical protein